MDDSYKYCQRCSVVLLGLPRVKPVLPNVCLNMFVKLNHLFCLPVEKSWIRQIYFLVVNTLFIILVPEAIFSINSLTVIYDYSPPQQHNTALSFFSVLEQHNDLHTCRKAYLKFNFKTLPNLKFKGSVHFGEWFQSHNFMFSDNTAWPCCSNTYNENTRRWFQIQIGFQVNQAE